MRLSILIASIAFLVSSLAARPNEPLPTATIRSHAILGQWHGNSYSVGEFGVVNIYTAKHWRKVWEEFLGRKQASDFEEGRHQAVYIELGVRPTGGYAVEVMRAYEEGKHLVLEYIEREPAPDRYVTHALTTPWVVVLLPRSELRAITRKATLVSATPATSNTPR